MIQQIIQIISIIVFILSILLCLLLFKRRRNRWPREKEFREIGKEIVSFWSGIILFIYISTGWIIDLNLLKEAKWPLLISLAVVIYKSFTELKKLTRY